MSLRHMVCADIAALPRRKSLHHPHWVPRAFFYFGFGEMYISIFETKTPLVGTCLYGSAPTWCVPSCSWRDVQSPENLVLKIWRLNRGGHSIDRYWLRWPKKRLFGSTCWPRSTSCVFWAEVYWSTSVSSVLSAHQSNGKHRAFVVFK